MIQWKAPECKWNHTSIAWHEKRGRFREMNPQSPGEDSYKKKKKPEERYLAALRIDIQSFPAWKLVQNRLLSWFRLFSPQDASQMLRMNFQSAIAYISKLKLQAGSVFRHAQNTTILYNAEQNPFPFYWFLYALSRSWRYNYYSSQPHKRDCLQIFGCPI